MKKTFILLFSLLLMFGAKQASGALTGVTWSATNYTPNATGVTYTFNFTIGTTDIQTHYFRVQNFTDAWTLTPASFSGATLKIGNATYTGEVCSLSGWTGMEFVNDFFILNQAGVSCVVTIPNVTNGVEGTYAWRAFATYTGAHHQVDYGNADALKLVIAPPPGPGAPTVTTNPTVSNVTLNPPPNGYSAIIGGNVTANGGSPITWTGIALAQVPEPTAPVFYTDNAGMGAFSVTCLYMAPNSTYYYRAYAENEAGLFSYGQTYSFVTPPLYPANPAPFAAAANSTSQINLSWALNGASNPVLVVFNTTDVFGSPDGTYSVGSQIPGGGTVLYVGSGLLYNHTALTINTHYYYKAYSKAPYYYSWGIKDDEWTLVNVPSAPTVGDATATSLNVTVNVNSNPANTEFCINETSTTNFVQADGTLNTTAVWQTASAWGTKTVSGLTTGSTYTFRVKARNGNSTETEYSLTSSANTCSNPTVAGSIGSDQSICSGSTPFALTNVLGASNYGGTLEYKWQSSTSSASGGFTSIGSSNAPTYTPGNQAVTIWYKRLARVSCKADWIGAAETNVVEITVQPLLVTTQPVLAITSTNATGNGNISSICGSNASNRGLIWYPYTGTDKTIGETDVTNINEGPGPFGSGAFTVSLSGFSANTRYDTRAHGTNTEGTGYGARVDFWTLANVPGKPTVAIPQMTSLNVSINANSNPAITTYAICDTVTSKFVQADGTLGASAVWQTKALWEVNASNSAKTITGLSENTKYVFKVKAKNAINVATDFSSKDSLYTLAKVPAAPTVNAATATSVNVAINANGNPAATTFAIQETGGSKYVQSDGTLGDNAVWQTEAVWETDATNTAKTVTGLSVNTQNTFKVKARNGDDVETAFSGTTSLYTLANVPSAPTVNNPTATTLDVTINVNGNPASTEFAIREATPNKSPGSRFVQANGTLGGTIVWATAATWGTKTVTGLTTGTTYTFEVKARNGGNVETAYGLSTAQSTCSNPTIGGTIGTNQTICYGTVPSTLTNITLPSNYGGTLEYKWQYSTNSASAGFDNDISLATDTAYSPEALNVTTWFRRLARVDCETNWIGASVSNVVKITVRPVFSAGSIPATGETICYNGNPAEIGNISVASGGDASISYQWQSSLDAAFTTPTDINLSTPTYNPPAGLTATTWYRRQAKDETCNTSWNTSTGVWKVTDGSPKPTLTGEANVTQSQVVTYSTPYNPGNSYSWNASHGNPELCFPYRNCLTLTWDFPCGVINPGYVTVTETNPTTGCSTTETKWITIAQ